MLEEQVLSKSHLIKEYNENLSSSISILVLLFWYIWWANVMPNVRQIIES